MMAVLLVSLGGIAACILAYALIEPWLRESQDK